MGVVKYKYLHIQLTIYLHNFYPLYTKNRSRSNMNDTFIYYFHIFTVDYFEPGNTMEGPFLSKLLTMSPVQIDDKALLFQEYP